MCECRVFERGTHESPEKSLGKIDKVFYRVQWYQDNRRKQCKRTGKIVEPVVVGTRTDRLRMEKAHVEVPKALAEQRT